MIHDGLGIEQLTAAHSTTPAAPVVHCAGVPPTLQNVDRHILDSLQ